LNIAEKFGRWFVVVLWSCAGAFCLSNLWFGFAVARAAQVAIVFSSSDVWYTAAGIAFFAGAYGIARRLRWARNFSLGLWMLFGYWNFGAIGFYADMRWFPLTALALLFMALLWLMSSAASETREEETRHT